MVVLELSKVTNLPPMATMALLTHDARTWHTVLKLDLD